MTTATTDGLRIEESDLDFLRKKAQSEDIQYFNARFSHGQSTTFSLLDRITKTSKTGMGHGFSIQSFYHGGWGLAIGHDFDHDSIVKIFNKSIKLAKWSSQYSKGDYLINETPSENQKYQVTQKVPLGSIDLDQKITDIMEIEKNTYQDPRIVSTQLNYSDYETESIYYNNWGLFSHLQWAGQLINLKAIAKEGQNHQGFFISNGKIGGYETLQNSQWMSEKAAKNALELLDSKPAPPGQFNIIMDPLLTGTFIHEAFGHAVEADSVLNGESLLAGKIGTRVGNEQVSVIDDATLENEYGFYPFDSEGIPGQHTKIIERGILKNYLHSLETASKMNEKPTGNGRAMGYSLSPLVRMSNTYLAPGDSSLDEMMREIKNGILCLGWKYGYTDPIDGSFMFKAAKAYIIENGEKKQVLRDTAISGITFDVLNRISLLSKDYEQDSGFCGKDGQSVAVGSGGPYTLIEDMVMGGQ